MASEYKIGTSHATLKAFSALSPALPDPRGEPMDYAEMVELADGSRRGMGWLRQTWHFGYLTEAQANALKAYVGPVYVYTRKNTGSFGYFTAELVWPEKEPEHYANHVIDITVELRKLVEYTP